ncbi:aspartate aminotransferase family protein [Marinobacter xestospongiae]|uniref:Aminotransferase class III-fold pyridoxal phosphate-dependent enzyme n=1 Tax=Marinobacter xestospongiae TaxID=994319 RepID=A0ABU3VSQ9_9GAMM|nr:aminotransferase class III-fold pyridoxal phosphate-dependent enzyme [Marinobacter xestospongiae]MDV2077288.1 aminotransferase class III-fold pyridoxal phosphate-dependent enzyme [Marinobacter xestospongiae]
MTDHKGKLSPLLKQATGIVAAKGEGCHIIDPEGRRYLDFTSGIGVTSTGHCHPKVVEAAQKQVATMIHAQATTVMNPRLPELAEKLGELTPDNIDAFFFSNAGTEVAEAGIRLVRQATGRPNIIVFHGGFHGRTMGSLSLTTSSVGLRAGVSPMMGGVVVAPFPHVHHYGWSEEETTDFCLRELDRIFVTYSAPKETAAMMIEPVQGEGGYVPANRRFMEGLRERANKHGIMLVFDEVQAGFGRSGQFWGHDHFGVKPDAIMIAKGLASGFPISALAASEDTMAKGWPGSQGGTYGGNAVAAAAALATIDVIREEQLVANAEAMGKRLRDGLESLQKDYPEMEDVRGLGLMQGVEMRRDGQPDGERAGKILKECEHRGLLMLRCGPYQEIVRWLPPLIVNSQQIDEALGIFEEALKATA